MLACAEETTVKISNLETGKVQSLSGSSDIAHTCSVRNAAIDSQISRLATVGCDGMLHLVNLETEKLIRKVQIGEKSQNFTPQALQVQWSPCGKYLLCSGKSDLTILDR